MSEEDLTESPGNKLAKLPLVAAVVALIGLTDAIYLTIHHYTSEAVPCGLTGGCEMVLSSAWSQIGGIPLSLFGAAAYFVAFSFSLLVAYGNRLLWKLFGLLAISMAGYSIYLIYVQKYLIHDFCQYCLLSAATSITLCIIALASRFWKS